MIKIGTCGFPVAMKKIFENLDCVEIQTTFYKLPNIENLKKIKFSAPKNFDFSFKVFQGITHDTKLPTWKRSGLNKDEIKKIENKVGNLRPTKEVFEYWEIMKEVAKTLDAKFAVIQTPASFKDDEENIKNVNEFFSSIKNDLKKIKVAIEFRGWKEENVIELAKKFGLIIITDPNLKIIKQKINYFRVHGAYKGKKIIYKYLFSDEELKNLYQKIKNLNCYLFFNNVYMFNDALRFKSLLQ